MAGGDSIMELTLPKIIVADRLRHRHFAIFKRPASVLLFLLIAAAVYWLWFGLGHRSINSDDGISIIAAEGVLRHGLPELPSGFLYHRGYVSSYLQAASIGIFGLNDFSILLASLVMSLGSIWLTYLIARDITGKPWLGVIAATLLVTLQAQTIYATGPRMYMPLQFFAALAVYAAWRGYLFNSGKFQLITLLSIGAAILSHRQAGLLLIAIPASIALATWVQGKTIPKLHFWQNALGLTAVMATAYFVFIYGPPNEVVSIAVHSGSAISHVGLQLSPLNFGKHLLNLERAVPAGISMLPVMAVVAAVTLNRRSKSRADNGMLFLMMVFVVQALLIPLVLKTTGVRFWVPLLPIYVVLIVMSLASIVTAARTLSGAGLRVEMGFGKSRLNSNVAVLGALAVGIVASIVLSALSPAVGFVENFVSGYGKPGQQSEWGSGVEAHYAGLQSHVGPGDLIISSNPWISYYYLGRVDGFLREKMVESGGFAPFGEGVTDEYYGVPMIDSQHSLELLMNSDKQVWIVTDEKKLTTFSSENTRGFLEANFAVFLSDGAMTTYVNCPGMDCSTAAAPGGVAAN